MNLAALVSALVAMVMLPGRLLRKKRTYNLGDDISVYPTEILKALAKIWGTQEGDQFRANGISLRQLADSARLVPEQYDRESPEWVDVLSAVRELCGRELLEEPRGLLGRYRIEFSESRYRPDVGSILSDPGNIRVRPTPAGIREGQTHLRPLYRKVWDSAKADLRTAGVAAITSVCTAVATVAVSSLF